MSYDNRMATKQTIPQTKPAPPPPKIIFNDDTVLARIEQLEQEKAQLRDQAIGELLTKRSELDEKLARLGYNTVPDRPRKSAGGARGYSPDKVCPICGQHGHDARKHRHEKRAQTAQATETAATA
jgi:hypothetical protein